MIKAWTDLLCLHVLSKFVDEPIKTDTLIPGESPGLVKSASSMFQIGDSSESEDDVIPSRVKSEDKGIQTTPVEDLRPLSPPADDEPRSMEECLTIFKSDVSKIRRQAQPKLL